VRWLERAAERADGLGRVELGARLRAKVTSLRNRLN
jgi:hypothetical protein